MKWFRKLSSTGDISIVPDIIDFFEKEHEDARKELQMTGRIETFSRNLPGIVEYRFAQLSELDMILKWLETQEDRALGSARRRYIEHYDRTLSDRTAEKYAETDDDVITLRMLRHEVAYVHGKFVGITKGFDIAGYQIRNIVELRTKGIEDSVF